MKPKKIRRPSHKICAQCGFRIDLIDCGVRGHSRNTMGKKGEHRDGTWYDNTDGCTGLVYSHVIHDPSDKVCDYWN